MIDQANYQTQLSPDQEASFQSWVRQNKIPWQDTPTADYDMRGYYKAMRSGDPNAQQKQSQFDGRMHFPDTYKTPYHATFSNESMYATPDAPHWVGNKLIDKSGHVVADETPKQMTGQDIDYEALARQHGAISSMPGIAPGKNGEIDYEAIAKQHGAISSQAAPAPAPNPYQQAAERIPGGTGTSMSAGPPKKPAEGPSWLERFIHAVGIPTSQGGASTAVQNVLTPQPEPGAEGLLKTEESLPVLGSDFRARAALARQGRPTSLIPFVGPAIASFVDSTVGDKPDTATALGSGVNVAGQAMGLKSLLTPKAPVPSLEVPANPPAANVTPAHVEALTGLLEDRGGTVDPHATATAALPTLRETAVRMKIDPTALKGRESGQATLKIAEQAVRDTQNEFNDIRKPYNSVLVDQKPIAQAYRDAITPELLANEPKVARALEKQAQKFDQPVPLEQVNQFRIRMNNQLNAFEQRGTTAQIMSDIETKAQKAATDMARNIEYDTVGRLSGLDPNYIRALKQREGSLIEVKSSLTKEYNRASGAQGEAVSESAREKLASTFPSKHGVEKSIIKNVFGPKPIDALNNRIQKMFADMGVASELAQYEQVQPPTAPQLEGGPSGPLPGGEDAIEEATRGGPGVQPPVAPDTSQTFSRGGKMGTAQGIADQVTAAKSGATTNATARVDAHKVAKAAIGEQVQAPVAPTTVGGQITPEHVAAENAFYTQARAELGANASPSAVLQRAQALKIEHTAKGAPPPTTPVPPTVLPTLTQKMQAQPLPTLRRVQPPAGGSVTATGTPQQQATALMLLVKQGKLTPAEADSKIQRLVGPGGRRMIRRPVGPE